MCAIWVLFMWLVGKKGLVYSNPKTNLHAKNVYIQIQRKTRAAQQQFAIKIQRNLDKANLSFFSFWYYIVLKVCA